MIVARAPLLGLDRLTSAITLTPAARKRGIGSTASGRAVRGGLDLVERRERLAFGEIDADAVDDLVENGHEDLAP